MVRQRCTPIEAAQPVQHRGRVRARAARARSGVKQHDSALEFTPIFDYSCTVQFLNFMQRRSFRMHLHGGSLRRPAVALARGALAQAHLGAKAGGPRAVDGR